MLPERKPGLNLSLEEKESLRSTASWLNTELGEGACFWRPDITTAIRTFPNPIMIDLDGTLVAEGDRENVNPQAQEALQKAENIGSVFIVTSGDIHIEYLKRLGLAGERTVVITRQNYPEDAPDFALAEVQKYIAMQQQSLGINLSPGDLSPDDFRLEDPSVKHLAPLFMKKYPIPFIDNTVYCLYRNPGIYGLLAINYPLSQHSQYKEFYSSVLDNWIPSQDLRRAMRTVETFYSTDTDEKTRELQFISGRYFGIRFPESNLQSYAMIAIGGVDLIMQKMASLSSITEITDYWKRRYFIRYTISSTALDGPIQRLEIRSDQESWNISLASSPIMQGINHGFNWLDYSKSAEGQLVEYGSFNMEEATNYTLRHNPQAKRVNVFQKFRDLFSNILP